MAEARDQILEGLRKALKRGALPAEKEAELTARLAAHRPNLIPARATRLDHAGRINLFIEMAEEVQTTVVRVKSNADVPAAIADYLATNNLPSRLVMTPDPTLDDFPWETRPLLEIRRGRAGDGDLIGVTGGFAGIAETGTLMLISGPLTPTRNNFLPDHHICVMRSDQIVASYEEAWGRLRAHTDMPRTVNFITGPSRTGDIEQRLELGAHGPRRLHIVLIEG
ncbi:MAG TPA: lactate utilization protein [Stellaceae bacterium]|nr:lactate utilization protein [Stellaceae bacterium]